MSMHTKTAKRISTLYDQAIRRPDADKDSALESVIAKVYSTKSDEVQADIFASLRECFDKYQSGITRRLALTTALRNYAYKRIHG